MDKITVDSLGLVMFNSVACNSIPFVSEKPNKSQQIAVYNSGKLFKTYKDALSVVPTKVWHLIVGREEGQLFQVGTFKQVLPCGRPSAQGRTISLLFINYGKLSCNKNQHFNCFKRVETDIYIEQGQAWHAYSKYQIYVASALTKGQGRSVVAGSKSATGFAPTPQFPLVDLNTSK